MQVGATGVECGRIGDELSNQEADRVGAREEHLRATVGLELAAQALNLRLKVLLTRKEAIFHEEAVLEVGEGSDYTGEICRHPLGETLRAAHGMGCVQLALLER